jgi:hypothetical protein
MLTMCLVACGHTGFIDREHLETIGQGPSGCVKSCEELGMRMTALVLVGNSVPGCVCQPLTTQPAAPLPNNAPAAAAPVQPQSVNDGAAASTTGYVVLAAAAAAARQQQMQEQQRRPAQQSVTH